MIVEASQIAVPVAPLDDAAMRKAVSRALGVGMDAVVSLELARKSLDVRKKRSVEWICTFVVELAENARMRPRKGVRVAAYEPPVPFEVERLPKKVLEAASASGPPVVVGMGPAGLFCALYLAKAGLAPLVVERGEDVDTRKAKVETFNAGGRLDTETNIQFGEGGAGTFSDGKLNTGIKNPHIRHVLRMFVDAGAPPEILTDAKPHIGTDILIDVVKNLREEIVEAGGDVRFSTRLDAIRWKDGRVIGVELHDVANGRDGFVETSTVVLACGHSARDTFEELAREGLTLERKPFAVGVRIEHPQKLIDDVRLGPYVDRSLVGAADYRLAVHNEDGRGVYTFCMCPGGEVVAAASEEGGVCTNGMSCHARDGKNANSALLVEIRPDDLEGDDPLEGIRFQRALERAAYAAGLAGGSAAPYTAPAQRVGDFLAGGPAGAAAEASARPSLTGAAAEASARSSQASADVASTSSACPAAVSPTYPRGVTFCDLHECLPPPVADALAQALPALDRKLPGFADPAAVMTAVEARSSSPVRIVRDRETLVAFAREGLYPCGEGAGYAGGIMSAAVDGLRVAEAIVGKAVRDARL